MQLSPPPDISSIVFDLDGTLYVSPSFAAAISDQAAAYISGLRGTSKEEAHSLMAETREKITRERESDQTLSAVCAELGGDIRDLHRSFEERLNPEVHLLRDQRVIDLLGRLKEHFRLYIYTNNNRALTTRILHYLGLNGMFIRIFTIDDTWRAKPDEIILGQVLADAGKTAAEVLFVGDRYDVDLSLPEMKGCPVFLTRSVEQLLRLEELIATPIST